MAASAHHSDNNAMTTRQLRTTGRRRPVRGHSSFPSGLVVDRRILADVAALGSVVLGTICVLALTFPSGQLTGPLLWWMGLALGSTAVLLPAWLVAFGLLRLLVAARSGVTLPTGRLIGAVLATLALPALIHFFPLGDPDPARRALELHSGGGAIGYYLSAGLREALGQAAAGVVLAAGLLLGLLLMLELTLTQVAVGVAVVGLLIARAIYRVIRLLFGGLMAAYRGLRRPRLRVNQARPSAVPARPLSHRLARVVGRPRHAPATEPLSEPLAPEAREPGAQSGWHVPPPSLLAATTAAELNQADVRSQARIIEDTLASFNIEARVVEVNSGPTVTQFGLEPGPGVSVNRILARSNDLALRLGTGALRLEAPVPGKRVVGVEVPNRAGALVSLRELLESEQWGRVRSKLRLALGRDVSGNPVIGDLARMPHLLISGATGSGKSVCINSIIASLTFQCTPDELQFLMIDPKMVELVSFNGIPHLRMPVVTDMERVVGSLKWVVREMERRFSVFAARATRNIDAYNKSVEADPTQKGMPFMVVVIDELADMMMTAGDEVERILCRLAQLARATGIHLVVATQRPSVDVITGLIKANFPTRISFAVSSHIDSRTILDTVGAEKLLGRGDMLFLPQDSSKPIRLQGAYISDEEIHKLVGFWRRLGGPRYSEEDVREIESLGRGGDDDDGDELYEKAVEVAGQYRRISTSLLQRRLGIGYPRAARLIDLLEERGVIGPSEDGKSRQVLEREAAAVD